VHKPETMPARSPLPSPIQPLRASRGLHRAESRGVKILEEWWSATRQNDSQGQPNPKLKPYTDIYCPYTFTLPKDRMELELTKGFEPPTL
jgi:hypothetical protein